MTPAVNPFGCVRFPFPAQIPLTHEKLALLRRNGLEEDIRARSHLLRGHGGLPSKLIDTLRVIFLPDDAVDRLVAASPGDQELPVALPTDVDAQVARLIDGTLRGLVGETETTAAVEGGRRRRIQDYCRAQQAIVAHNLAQVEAWASEKRK
jgi:hypothetical protein